MLWGSSIFGDVGRVPGISIGPDAEGNLLVTESDRITHFGPEGPPASTSGGQMIDCSGGRIRPGRVNAHTHIYSGLAPFDMPEPEQQPDNFVQILERIWWRLDRALDADSLEAAARFYVAEALLAGTSTLIDHHESPNFIDGSLDVLADTCQELGMRAILCFGATERNGGQAEARQGLAECRRFILSNRRPLVRGVVGLHASFTVSDDIVREAGELCRELGVVMHVHMAEDLADVEDARRRGYPGPLERLLELGALPPGSILAHGVHLDREQVRQAADQGLWLVQNPRSNRGNRVGYPNALTASPRVALGTDGYPARMAEEVEALAEEAADHGEPEEVVETRANAGWGLIAEAFGSSFVPLGPGSIADVVVEAGELRHLIVGGEPVVLEGQLLTGDLDRIRSEAQAKALHLWKRMVSLN